MNFVFVFVISFVFVFVFISEFVFIFKFAFIFVFNLHAHGEAVEEGHKQELPLLFHSPAISNIQFTPSGGDRISSSTYSLNFHSPAIKYAPSAVVEIALEYLLQKEMYSTCSAGVSLLKEGSLSKTLLSADPRCPL